MIGRGRLVARGVTGTVVAAASVGLLLSSRTADCGVSAPRPSLSAALRALGDFDQAYNASNVSELEDAATRVAAAQYPALIGTTAEPPVPVHAVNPGQPDALVVPLLAPGATSGGPTVSGLVVFLRDCNGTAFYSTVENDVTAHPAITEFPPVSRSQAALSLESSDLVLTYGTSPLQPQWRTAVAPVRATPAR